jgi:hypothetical protein
MLIWHFMEAASQLLPISPGDEPTVMISGISDYRKTIHLLEATTLWRVVMRPLVMKRVVEAGERGHGTMRIETILNQRPSAWGELQVPEPLKVYWLQQKKKVSV